MNKIKMYAKKAWAWTTDLMRKYPVKASLTSAALGLGLGYWIWS